MCIRQLINCLEGRTGDHTRLHACSLVVTASGDGVNGREPSVEGRRVEM